MQMKRFSYTDKVIPVYFTAEVSVVARDTHCTQRRGQGGYVVKAKSALQSTYNTSSSNSKQRTMIINHS